MMMKKIMLVLALGLFLFSACNQGGDSYTIKGKLTNLQDSVLYLAQQKGNMPVFDTLKITDGKFTFKGKTQEPVFAQIITPDQRAGFPLILEPGTIHISGNADSMMAGKIKISGTPNNEALQQFMDIQQPYIPTMMQMQGKAMQAQMSGNTETMDSIRSVMDSIEKEITGKMKGFIKDHPESIVSAIALQSIMSTIDDSAVSTLYAGLDTAVQNSPFGEQIGDKVATAKKTAIGKMAPDFTMENPEGESVSLSDLRGKYVLIDFWASWCGPCRAENPNVVEAYNQYKDNNFTILGVSLDKDKDAWEKAIEDDDLNWHQVSDLKYWDNAAAKLYGVQAIPANFLLDPQGKIIAKNLRGNELQETLSSVLPNKQPSATEK